MVRGRSSCEDRLCLSPTRERGTEMLGAFRETKSIAATFCNDQLVERAREIASPTHALNCEECYFFSATRSLASSKACCIACHILSSDWVPSIFTILASG